GGAAMASAESDPTTATLSRPRAANEYMLRMYLSYVLTPAERRPDLSLIWFRSPDSTEHDYGPGTRAYQDAVREQDRLLGLLVDRLTALGLLDTTDTVVVSDHGHSTVSGPLSLFPRRNLVSAGGMVTMQNGPVTAPGETTAVSASGDVRLAELLANANF